MKIDTEYRCVMKKPTKATTLYSLVLAEEVKGIPFLIPSRHLLLTPGGKVFIRVSKRGQKVEYASLDSLLETVKATTIIENFSKP